MSTATTTLTYEDHIEAYAAAMRHERDAIQHYEEAERRYCEAQRLAKDARDALREYDMKRVAEVLEG